MAYFYYVLRAGKPWPRLTSLHPKDRLAPETPFGAVIEVKSPQDNFTLDSLSVLYPPQEISHDQR